MAKKNSVWSILLLPILVSGVVYSLGAQDPKAMLKQQIAAVKASLAQNQQALRQYTWTETTTMTLKGDEKNRNQKECHYGPDGQVVKTQLGAAPEQSKKRGLKGRVIEKKVGELKDYLERAAALIHHYAPPDQARMQTAFENGRAALSKNIADASTMIEFKDYYKSGDSMVLKFSQGKVRSVSVKSYLDDLSDAVTLNARFKELAEGPNVLEESVLNVAAKQVQVLTTNSDHRKSNP